MCCQPKEYVVQINNIYLQGFRGSANNKRRTRVQSCCQSDPITGTEY
jgi:hypothetical protein